MRIAVIGAGIVGSAVGLRLSHTGHDVSFFDPAPEGRPASYGNAGHIGTASILPWASVANLKSAWSCHRDPAHPLVLHPLDLLRQPRWARRFLTACHSARNAASATVLADLLSNADSALARLMEEADCSNLRRSEGLLHVYLSQASRQGAEPGLVLRQEKGIEVRRLSAGDLFDLEPDLVPPSRRAMIDGATLFPGVGQVLSPHRVMNAFRKAARAPLIESAVSKVDVTLDGVRLHTVVGTSEFDGVVIAAGRNGARLAAPLGARVPVIAERGYHLQYRAPAKFRRSALFVDMRVVASPMCDGLRLTSGAEFCLPERAPDHARMAPVFERAQALLGLETPPDEHWSGDRPSTPDSLPVLGATPHSRRVFLAYGHGHLGLTMSGVTAELANAHFLGTAGTTSWDGCRSDR